MNDFRYHFLCLRPCQLAILTTCTINLFYHNETHANPQKGRPKNNLSNAAKQSCPDKPIHTMVSTICIKERKDMPKVVVIRGNRLKMFGLLAVIVLLCAAYYYVNQSVMVS